MFHLIRQMAPPVGDMRTHHEKHSFHIYLLDDSAIALKPSEDIVLVLHWAIYYYNNDIFTAKIQSQQLAKQKNVRNWLKSHSDMLHSA